MINKIHFLIGNLNLRTQEIMNENLIRKFFLSFGRNFMGEIQSDFNYLIDDTYQIDYDKSSFRKTQNEHPQKDLNLGDQDG
jgi:hypothetical protein